MRTLDYPIMALLTLWSWLSPLAAKPAGPSTTPQCEGCVPGARRLAVWTLADPQPAPVPSHATKDETHD